MATITMQPNERETRREWVVVHPLDDAPETKVDTEALGPMPMTTAVRASLFALRAYLVLMLLIVAWYVIRQATH